jgi:hypothetical protein
MGVGGSSRGLSGLVVAGWVGLWMGGWALAGCKRDEAPPPMPEAPGGAVPPPQTIALPAQTTAPVAPRPTVPPRAGPGAAPPSVARSPIPAPQEFDSQREVTVRHSSSLQCETKMVREWLRVRCPYTQETASVGGGDVKINQSTHKGELRVTHFARPMEALVPVVPGCSHSISFNGDWGYRWLTVNWPAGASHALMYFDQPATPASCRVPSDCTTNVCCYLPLDRKGFCSTSCDVGVTTFTCRTDADCPVVFSKKTRCVPDGDFRICQ